MCDRYTTHHRKPRSIGGTSDPRNLVRISEKKHAAWHLLFRNLEPDEIAYQINRFYLDPDFEFVVRETGKRF